MNQPDTVPELLSADLPAGVFLLDVREDDEWTAGHAPEAVLSPVWSYRSRIRDSRNTS